jgi:threonine dehydrogenase-like Zn-dependent dehydrogenase
MEKKLLYHESEKNFTITELEARPSLDKLGSKNILVQPLCVGICGSDINRIERDDPICIGHEWVGEVIEGNQSQYTKGDLVMSPAKLFCGTCSFCEQDQTNLCVSGNLLGSQDLNVLRSWITIDHSNLVLLPKIDPHALCLLEVCAIADEALAKLQELTQKKSKLLIFGGGAVGLLTALAAQKQGYDVLLVEKENYRAEQGKKLGIETLPLTLFLTDPSFRHSFSEIIDCTGDSRGGTGALTLLPFYGSVNCSLVLVGIYHREHAFQQELYQRLSAKISWVTGASYIRLSNSVKTWYDIEKISQILISHRFNLEEINQAINVAKDPAKSLKVLLLINKN